MALMRDNDNVWRESPYYDGTVRESPENNLLDMVRADVDPGWGIDTRDLDSAGELWLALMENPRWVIIREGLFRYARCSLSYAPGHRHTKLCAGPRAALGRSFTEWLQERTS